MNTLQTRNRRRLLISGEPPPLGDQILLKRLEPVCVFSFPLEPSSGSWGVACNVLNSELPPPDLKPCSRNPLGVAKGAQAELVMLKLIPGVTAPNRPTSFFAINFSGTTFCDLVSHASLPPPSISTLARRYCTALRQTRSSASA